QEAEPHGGPHRIFIKLSFLLIISFRQPFGQISQMRGRSPKGGPKKSSTKSSLLLIISFDRLFGRLSQIRWRSPKGAPLNFHTIALIPTFTESVNKISPLDNGAEAEYYSQESLFQ